MNSDSFEHVETGAYFSVPGYTDYEICDTFPYEIRKRKTGKVVKEHVHKATGYVVLSLNSQVVKKHRIVALTFIPNPQDLPVVDHGDNDRANFHIENLRWTTQKQNSNNRYDQKFVDEIPDDSIVVERYGDYKFDFLYFSQERDEFYFFNGLNYNIRPIHLHKRGYYKIQATDVTGKRRSISLNTFKKEYGLI